VSAPDLSAFSDRACVVTGGLGFIGSNLAVQLAGAGAKVTVIDALIPRHGGSRTNLHAPEFGVSDDAIEVVIADIGDTAAVSGPVGRAEFVFNLAGQVSHVDSMEDPLGDLAINAASQLRFLETIRQVNPGAVVVYGSTRQIYGKPRYLPVDEEHPIVPVDVNGVNKWAGEQFHILYAKTHGLRSCALRLTNIYGPRQRLLGDHHGVLPVFMRKALEGQTIQLFGDGMQERDVLHVDDVVAAFAQAALAPEMAGEVFNIGSPEKLTLRSIAETIVAAAGTNSRVELEPWPHDRLKIDIGSYATDCSKAKRMLGWEASTPFAAGMAETLAFFRAHAAEYL
jgi:UDP-glucose 4-epimerase